VDRRLRAAGLEPVRNLVGSYITSLEMAGCSITILKLDDEETRVWDATVLLDSTGRMDDRSPAPGGGVRPDVARDRLRAPRRWRSSWLSSPVDGCVAGGIVGHGRSADA